MPDSRAAVSISVASFSLSEPVCLSQTEIRQMLKIAVDRFERTPSLTALVD
jgi:hypothetical protein